MRFPREIKSAVPAILLAVCFCIPSDAGNLPSSYPPDDLLQSLVSGAKQVFIGRCVDLKEEPVPGSGRSIVTATFQVHETLAGPDTPLVVFRYPSGPSPGGKPAAGDMPGGGDREARALRWNRGASGRNRTPVRFHVGEEVVLFLPPLTGNGFLRSGTPGFAKLSVATVGSGGDRVAIASAGPAELTSLPYIPLRHGNLDTLLWKIRQLAMTDGEP